MKIRESIRLKGNELSRLTNFIFAQEISSRVLLESVEKCNDNALASFPFYVPMRHCIPCYYISAAGHRRVRISLQPGRTNDALKPYGYDLLCTLVGKGVLVNKRNKQCPFRATKAISLVSTNQTDLFHNGLSITVDALSLTHLCFSRTFFI